MSDNSFELIVDGILELFCLIGGGLHWLLFLGQKPYGEVRDARWINGVIGLVAVVLIIWLLWETVLELLLQMINNRLNK